MGRVTFGYQEILVHQSKTLPFTLPLITNMLEWNNKCIRWNFQHPINHKRNKRKRR